MNHASGGPRVVLSKAKDHVVCLLIGVFRIDLGFGLGFLVVLYLQLNPRPNRERKYGLDDGAM